ncbi:MAG: hypothetical protein M3P49_14270 [Actinomycetota bacterium]|nr:hypothetical protein [Actinomycetota bacterium]
MEKDCDAWVTIVTPEIHPRDLTQLEAYVDSVLSAKWDYSLPLHPVHPDLPADREQAELLAHRNDHLHRVQL